ncbi:MAG: cobyrinate a,c-diamide synthase [Deltaproteobacteria bacterium]|nr:cobyrinate a,c-diamide synthase [Deltaproteobacteria bacterium]
MSRSAFIIAGVSSGVGKTTISLGLMAIIKKRGLEVQPFKGGPDYIDAGHHSAVCTRPSCNLDTWMMGEEGVCNSFMRNMAGADVGIVEGVMGLYDGKDAYSDEGSTAHLAKVLGLSIILIVDASAMARSAAAIVHGFENFDMDVNIGGVIFNRVGSEGHFKILKEAVESSSSVKVLGYLPREEEISIAERHLGLVMPLKNHQRDEEKIATLLEQTVNVDELLKISHIDVDMSRESGVEDKMQPESTPLIAVARDSAFCFYYEENLHILREAGARLVNFSPIHDRSLPEQTTGIYIGGGYPELYGSELAANVDLKSEIKERANKGMPVYAECGGLIYLGKSITNVEGAESEMVGLFPWKVRMFSKLRALGYREITAKSDFPFIKKGETIRGHEFRYSGIEAYEETKTGYSLSYGQREEGYLYKKAVASYIHLHFASNPDFAEGFVSSCREWMNTN